MLMFGLFFVLYFVKLSVGIGFMLCQISKDLLIQENDCVTQFGVDIAGSSLFDAIGHLRPPPSALCPQTKSLPYQK